jgi:hypothetical protein
MAFADLVSELKGDFPRLSPFLAQKFVNRAWSEIRDSDNWSFLEGQATLQVPAVVNTGTISCTQFSATITGDATATTAWTPLLTGTPPFVASTNAAGQALIGTGYQIRWLNGPLYSVIASDSGSPVMTLTLDRIVSEKSGSGIAYQAFRAYYGAPATDWLNWLTIVNQAQGYPISGRRLNGSQAQLNRIDPQRTATGDPWFLFSLYADVNGMPVREMWPIPVTQMGMPAVYKRRGTDLSAANPLPSSFPENVLLERARQYCCQWAASQRREPGDQTDWQLAAKIHRQNFDGPEPGAGGLLALAKKADTSLRTPVPVIRRGPYGGFAYSGEFLQTHDVGRMISAFPNLGGY